MGNGPDRRKNPRYGLYRTEKKAPSADLIARVIADLPREFDRAGIERALSGPMDKPIIVRNAPLDLKRLKGILEAIGIPVAERQLPDRRAEARKQTLAGRMKSMLGLAR